MAKPNPFAAFEKSKKDKEPKGHGKEGSKKEEAFDKTEGMKKGGKVQKKACGGKIKGKAAGGVMRGTGAAIKGKSFAYDG